MTEYRTTEHMKLMRRRRLERLCETFEIDPFVAALLLDLTHQINELEEEVEKFRGGSAPFSRR